MSSHVKHTLVALVQDHPGVLTRVVSLFRRRNFNIESLAVGHSETPGISRLTLVVDAADVEQVIKQLYRLIEVLKVSDLTNDAAVERELALIKVHAPKSTRSEIVALTNVYGARIVDVGTSSMVVEMSGTPAKVDSLLELLRPFGLREMMRTGRIAMVRGSQVQRMPGEWASPAEAEIAPKLAAAS
jgi:acetolactate synthase I/III small subunit